MADMQSDQSKGRKIPHAGQATENLAAETIGNGAERQQRSRQDQAELLDILQSVEKGCGLVARHRQLYTRAIEAGLIEHHDPDQLYQSISELETEIEYCEDELKVIQEAASAPVTTANTASPEALQRLADQAAERSREAEEEYNALIRSASHPLKRLGNYVREVLSSLPIIGDMITIQSDEQAIEEANQKRVDLLYSSRQAQQELVKCHIRLQEQSTAREDMHERRNEISTQRDGARNNLQSLAALKKEIFGFAKLTARGIYVRAKLERPDTDLALPAGQFLDRLASTRSMIRQQIETAEQFRNKLVDLYLYPELGAEIVSWSLINRTGSPAELIKSFHSCHQMVSRFVRPSYTQLLLSLHIQAADAEPVEALNQLSKMSRNLPNFERSERYLVAHAKTRITGKDEPEKQMRLMQFVDLLTGPNGETLKGFERYILAARLGAFPDADQAICDRFELVQQGIRERGIAPGFESGLATVTLMQSEMHGDDRFERFDRIRELLQAQNLQLNDPLLLECAYVSILPGDSREYLDSLDIARIELLDRKYTKEQAAVLALPAAMSAIKKTWGYQIEREAFQIAEKVNQIDEKLAVREYRDHREEIRRARLEEELLNNLASLQKLYSGVNGSELGRLWQEMSDAAAAKNTIEIDEGQTGGAPVAGARRARPARSASSAQADKLEALLIAEEELQRELRESSLGGEDQ